MPKPVTPYRIAALGKDNDRSGLTNLLEITYQVNLAMEKRTPHCKLSAVKALVEAGKVRVTVTALTGGAALGLDFEGMVGLVVVLTPQDFHKSMTTHADHRIWQDVYCPATKVGEVYLKLTVIDDVLIVSFKEL